MKIPRRRARVPAEFRSRFRERYLGLHENFVDSSGWLISYGEGGRWYARLPRAQEDLQQHIGKMRKRHPGGLDSARQILRNLRAAWYHECALRYPFDNEGSRHVDERMRWAAWQIVKCYYSVFAAISAWVRCTSDMGRASHDKVLRVFASSVVAAPAFDRLLHVPFIFRLEAGEAKPGPSRVRWRYGRKNHLPVVVSALRWAAERKPEKVVTFYHYLRQLREWVNYEDPALFVCLYGKDPRRRLDSALLKIADRTNLQLEAYLTMVFGEGDLLDQLDKFELLVEEVQDKKLTFLRERLEEVAVWL